MNFKAPRLPIVLLVFLILGPYLLPIIFEFLILIMNKEISNISNPLGTLLVMLMSGITFIFFWWWSAFFDAAQQGWRFTILPTVIAALLYWSVIFFICEKRQILFKSRFIWILSNVLISACISGVVIYFTSQIFGFGIHSIPTKAPYFQKNGLTEIGVFVESISILGGLLGLILALFSEQKLTNG